MTTHLLIGICGLLCLVAIVQYAGVGSGYRWLVETPDSSKLSAAGSIDRQAFKLPPAAAFAAIEQHPLFNDDRQPTPADAEDDVAGEAPPANPLNVTLTGVIVTPSVRIALIRDNARNLSVALKVGMPLEGDQANWTLTEIKPRSAVFRSAADEDSEIELKTAEAPTTGSSTPRGRATNSGRSAFRPATEGAKDSHASDTELAKRIEERRRQMREDAARLRKLRAQEHKPAHK